MIQLLKIKIQKVKKLLKKITYNRKSYSEAGEDRVIEFLLKGIGLDKLKYLELGTSHPKNGNNTYLFYKNGSRGVLVEPDKSLISVIKSARKKDKVLNVGVGILEQVVDFYVFESYCYNTFSIEEAEVIKKICKLKMVVKVQVKTINSIISENFNTFPDLLAIDIEGLDFQVLKTLDFSKYPIPIICAETHEYSANHIKMKNRSIEDFLKTKGYFVYADTYINSIFVNTKWFNSIVQDKS
jgi:FkbM family methyltransferase